MNDYLVLIAVLLDNFNTALDVAHSKFLVCVSLGAVVAVFLVFYKSLKLI